MNKQPNQEPSQEEQVLTDGIREIKSLRSSNAVMSARLNMFDDMMLLFRSSPTSHNDGASPNPLWKMEQRLNEIKNPPCPPSTDTTEK